LIVKCLLAPDCLAVGGDWHSITHLDRINCLQFHNGVLFAGTTGGIRKIDPVSWKQEVFNNPANGILDVEIVGMTVSTDGKLWASSRNGMLYRLEGPGIWATVDRGFQKLDWKFNKRAIISAGKYLVLGSTRGLSFFLHGENHDQVDINLTGFGEERDISVTALLKKDSLLYIGTPKGVFRATLYWDDLLHPDDAFAGVHGSVFNPQIWEKLLLDSSGAADSASMYTHLSLEGDSIRVYAEGSSVASPFFARAIPGEPLIIKEESYPGITSMEAVAIREQPLFVIDTVVVEGVFVGDSTGLYFLSNGELQFMHEPLSLPSGQVANIHGSNLGTYIWNLHLDQVGYPSFIYKREGPVWRKLPQFILSQYLEPIAERIQALTVPAENEFYLGTWGTGIHYYRDGEITKYDASSCLTGIPASPTFVVVHAITPHEGQGIFGGLYHIEEHYSLAHVGSDGVVCYDESVIPDQNSTIPYKLKVVDNSFLLVSTDNGLHSFEITDPESPSGLSALKAVTPPDPHSPDILAANLDHFGRLWATGFGTVFYEDDFLYAEHDSLIALDEFAGEECYYVKKDGAGNLWMGCLDGLVKVVPGEKTPVKSIRRYRNQDGLLANEIVNFHIDKASGEIWIATKKGVNMFESGIVQFQNKLDRARVFPNPFTTRHQFVYFHNLTSSSEVFIFNQSGNLVFTASAADLHGGPVKWDGTNQHGRKVKPGVYFYAVKANNSAARGKIIVAR
ncbi:gliding motility-associated C-terminal domain-containing protein, partial [Fibrobacterota bacterium]